MTAEQLFWAWCKSEILSPKRLVYRSKSYYYDAIQGGMRMKKPKQKKRSRKGEAPIDQDPVQSAETGACKVPHSAQRAGLYSHRRIWADGIFQVGHQFSKTWSFTDINYSNAGKEDKTAMFLDYCDLLNALDSGASAKITLYNRRINKEEFERSVLLPFKGDGLDNYREEFNEMPARPGHREQ